MHTTHLDRRTFIATGLAGVLLPSCVTGTASTPHALVWRKLRTEPFRGKQDDIAFGSPDVGWYGNGEGRIYKTVDGGETWTLQWHHEGTFVRALGFADSRLGVLGNVGTGVYPNVSDTTPLYRTIDGGANWVPVETIEGPRPRGICGIHVTTYRQIVQGEMVTRRIFYAAGRVGGPAHFLRSGDDGVTWSSSDLSAQTSAIYDVRFLNPRVGFIAGSSDPDLGNAHGLILMTSDGGDSWRQVLRSARPFEAVWKLSFPGPRIGYATIQSYDPDPANTQRYVAKTMDGGRTWAEIPVVANHGWRSFGIGFVTSEIGWVGGNSASYETRNGGRIWSPIDLGPAVNKFRMVEAPGVRRVYAIGSEVHRLDFPL